MLSPFASVGATGAREPVDVKRKPSGTTWPLGRLAVLFRVDDDSTELVVFGFAAGLVRVATAFASRATSAERDLVALVAGAADDLILCGEGVFLDTRTLGGDAEGPGVGCAGAESGAVDFSGEPLATVVVWGFPWAGVSGLGSLLSTGPVASDTTRALVGDTVAGADTRRGSSTQGRSLAGESGR